MPPSSQAGRSKLKKQSSSQQGNNRNIRDFFKPFTIPRNRIPANDVVEDEIVLASPKKTSSISSRSSSPLTSPRKSQHSVKKGRVEKRSSGHSTPTKSKRSPVKAGYALQLDGADDSESLHHESPPFSQQRIMSAVEIPSSMKKRPSPTPPLPTEPSAQTTATMNNTSFNSFSTLSSVPLSSQASSSRRIVKNGVPVVTNSDSGSAEDSEDELQDIVFIPRKKLKTTPSPPPTGNSANPGIEVPSTAKPAARQGGRLSGKKSTGTSRTTTPGRRASPEPKPANTSVLMKLVREKEKREKEEAKIREAESAFEEEQKAREEKMRRQRDLGGGLQALVADDSDEGERMMLAMQRTEAMGEEETFFYLEGVSGDVEQVPEPDKDDVEGFGGWRDVRFKRLKTMVLDPRAREQACLSGFLAEVAGKFGMPSQLMNWIFSRLVRESSEELCEAYVEVFRRYLEREDAETAVYASLQKVYVLKDLDRKHGNESSGRKTPKAGSGGLPQGLRYILQVIQYACPHQLEPFHADTFLQLALANIDQRVNREAKLRAQVQESLAAIIYQLQQTKQDNRPAKIWRESLAEIALSLPLCCRLITSLPAHTKSGHVFRRSLALHALASDHGDRKSQKQQRYPVLSNDARWGDLILSTLKTSPTWSISESTNYTHLNAVIPILDISIDAGFPSPPPTTKPLDNKNEVPAVSEKEREKSFNRQVDALVDQIRAMSSRIRDAGTSHLGRTEAKTALERVAVRVEHCVRTRPRPAKGVFGSGGGAGRQMGFMSGFLGRGNGGGGGGKEGKERRGKKVVRGKQDGDWVSVVDEGALSDREGDTDGDGGEEEEDVVGGAERDGVSV